MFFGYRFLDSLRSLEMTKGKVSLKMTKGKVLLKMTNVISTVAEKSNIQILRIQNG